MTQKQQILEWLKVGPITAAFAIEHGIYRSAARVCELRKDGYDIRTLTEPNARKGVHGVYEMVG